MDWLLLLPYLAVQVLIFILMLGAGWIMLRGIAGSAAPFADRSLNVCGAFAAGICAWSASLAWAGLAGILNAWTAGALALGGICGVLLFWKEALRNPAPLVFPGAIEHAKPGHWARRGLLAYAVIMAAWIVVGSAAPDLSQDGLWYHLTVPRAWTQRGTIEAFPLNMPSNYPLGFEAIYAGLLLFFDEPACSMFYGLTTLGCIGSFAALAAAMAGPAGRWIGAALALMLWTSVAVNVPIGAGNDLAAELLLTWGVCLLAAPEKIMGHSAARRAALPLAGILLGGAAAVKLVTAGFSLPFAALMILMQLRSAPRLRDFAREALFFAAAWTAMLAPWMLRNVFQGCGNPLFPLARGLFPAKSEYAGMAASSLRLNYLFPLSAEGFRRAWEHLHYKWIFFSTVPDSLFLAFAFLAPLGLCLGRGWTRRLGAALCLQLAAFFWIGGTHEVARYFALCYGAAVPLGAGLYAALQTYRPNVRRAAVCGIALAMMLAAGAYWDRQWRRIHYKTIAWPGRPVLTLASRESYARLKENCGVLSVPLRALGEALPRDARVVLPNWPYPFHLNRWYWWADEVSPPFPQAEWRGLDAQGVFAWLREHGATQVVFVGEYEADGRIENLARQGLLVHSFFDAGDDWPRLNVYSINEFAPALRGEMR